jgi:hypothetical protein
VGVVKSTLDVSTGISFGLGVWLRERQAVSLGGSCEVDFVYVGWDELRLGRCVRERERGRSCMWVSVR